MSTAIPTTPAIKPWYAHPWPWLLMLGPLLVIVAGTYTMWLAFSQSDALVVDDYYKQGKAINQDLRRDRAAQALGMKAMLRYEATRGELRGVIASRTPAQLEKVRIRLIHSTRPDKDIALDASPDSQGRFAIALPMLDIARWQVLIESGRGDWRLTGVWAWPQQPAIELDPVAPAG